MIGYSRKIVRILTNFRSNGSRLISVLVPVSRKSWKLFEPEMLFYVCRACIQDQSFNNFENDTIKL